MLKTVLRHEEQKLEKCFDFGFTNLNIILLQKFTEFSILIVKRL